MDGTLQMHSAEAHVGALKIFGFPLGIGVKFGMQPGPFVSLDDEFVTSLKALQSRVGIGA